MKNKNLLTRREASAYLGIAYGTMCNWHSTSSQRIPTICCGRKKLYRIEDLDRWIESRTINRIEESEITDSATRSK
jgi:hypothetical protein